MQLPHPTPRAPTRHTCSPTTGPPSRGRRCDAGGSRPAAHRDHRAALRSRAGRRARPRPDPPARRRAGGAADHRHRPGARRERRPVPTRCSRSGRPTPPAATGTPATAGRRRSTRTSPASAAPSPTRRALPVRHGPARRVPVGQPRQRLAPAHIHFSLFGRAFTQRLVTQMYFPDDPLFGLDPIFNSVPDQRARARLVSSFDHPRPNRRGRSATGSTSCCAAGGDPVRGRRVTTSPTHAAQTVARSCTSRWPGTTARTPSPKARPVPFWIRGRLLDGEGEPVADGMIETWQADPDGASTTRTTRAGGPHRRLPWIRPLLHR